MRARTRMYVVSCACSVTIIARTAAQLAEVAQVSSGCGACTADGAADRHPVFLQLCADVSPRREAMDAVVLQCAIDVSDGPALEA